MSKKKEFDLLEFEYSTVENGKHITVPTFDDCIKSIERRYEHLRTRIKTLEKENEKLKDEHYKDKEIKRITEENERLRENYRNGFPLTKEECDAINKWKEKHEKKTHKIITPEQKMTYGGAIGGTYTYHFTPTTIGVIGTIQCTCGEEFTFKNLD